MCHNDDLARNLLSQRYNATFKTEDLLCNLKGMFTEDFKLAFGTDDGNGDTNIDGNGDTDEDGKTASAKAVELLAKIKDSEGVYMKSVDNPKNGDTNGHKPYKIEFYNSVEMDEDSKQQDDRYIVTFDVECGISDMSIYLEEKISNRLSPRAAPTAAPTTTARNSIDNVAATAVAAGSLIGAYLICVLCKRCRPTKAAQKDDGDNLGAPPTNPASPVEGKYVEGALEATNAGRQPRSAQAAVTHDMATNAVSETDVIIVTGEAAVA